MVPTHKRPQFPVSEGVATGRPARDGRRGSRAGRSSAALVAMAVLLGPASAWGYLDMPMVKLTIPRLMLEFKNVAVCKVEFFEAGKGAARFRVAERLQGQSPDEMRYAMAPYGKLAPQFASVKAGDAAVVFSDDPYGRAVVFLAGTFFVANWDKAGGWWRLAGVSGDHYEMRCAFVGSAEELADACSRLLLGQEVVVRCLREPKNPATQWVRYDLRQPHAKMVVESASQATSGAEAATPPADPVTGIADSQPAVRILAARALGERGAQAVGLLRQVLTGDKDPLVRRACAAALARIGPPAIEAVGDLVASFRGGGYGETEDMPSAEAALAVAKIDPAGKAWLPIVEAGLGDKSADRRTKAARIVTLLREAGRPALSRMIQAAGDPSPSVRYEAATAIGLTHTDAAVVVPVLLKAALKDENNHVRYASQVALGRVGGPAVAALAQALLTEKDVEVRRRAVDIINWFGQPREAAEALKQVSADANENEEIRKIAAKALKRIQRP